MSSLPGLRAQSGLVITDGRGGVGGDGGAITGGAVVSTRLGVGGTGRITGAGGASAIGAGGRARTGGGGGLISWVSSFSSSNSFSLMANFDCATQKIRPAFSANASARPIRNPPPFFGAGASKGL